MRAEDTTRVDLSRKRVDSRISPHVSNRRHSIGREEKGQSLVFLDVVFRGRRLKLSRGGRPYEMNMHVGQTGHEEFAFAVDLQRIARHFDGGRGRDLGDSPALYDDGLVMQNLLLVHGNDSDIDESYGPFLGVQPRCDDQG
jgi:hypothetical protein